MGPGAPFQPISLVPKGVPLAWLPDGPWGWFIPSHHQRLLMDPINNTASALGHPQCLPSTSKGLDIYEWMVIKFILLKGRQSVFGTLWSPGMSGTGRLSAWSTGCPLHDLTTSQAAMGKKSRGWDASADCRGPVPSRLSMKTLLWI